MATILIAVISGLLGLLVAGILARYVLRQPEGSPRVVEISKAIREGATAFLGREYRVLAIIIVVIVIVMGVVPGLGWLVSLAFIFGALCSGLAGFTGMSIAVRANSRTTTAAQKGLSHGLKVSFRAGSVMGLCVVSIGLLGLSILYLAFHNHPDFIELIPGFGFGASLVAVFARLGGGIYTKAADTGADIVGKVERVFLRTTRATQQLSLILLVTMWAMSPAWGLTSSNRMLTLSLLP